MKLAGVYSVRDITELSQMVDALSREGFRIITVISTPNEMHHVVAQQEYVLRQHPPLPEGVTMLLMDPEDPQTLYTTIHEAVGD